MVRMMQWLVAFSVCAGVFSCARSSTAPLDNSTNAQQTTTAPEIKPSPPTFNRSVVGRVIDNAQNPIAGARVFAALTKNEPTPFRTDQLSEIYMQRSRVTETLTGPDGRFILDGFAHNDEVELAVQAKGYADDRRSARLNSGYEETVRDMVLAPGRELRGTATAPDGSPITDAIIATEVAWMSKGDRQLPWAFTLTDNAGNFVIGVDPETDWLSLRIISERYGQYFFIQQHAQGELSLRMDERARLSGTVSASPGTPLEDLVVLVVGEVPEPLMYSTRTGHRSGDPRFVAVDKDGRFTFPELYPGLKYRANVLRRDAEKPRQFHNLLEDYVYYEFKPGNKGEWNPSIPES